MITLNNEKGLVRIESWDDIVTRPGFVANVDPKAVKLKEIIGSYAFDTMISCGLSTCHQPHGTGFLVVTDSGNETNIGRICGKRHFSVEFTQMSRVFLNALRAQQNREILSQLKNRLPAVAGEVATIKSEKYGASWIYSRINQLTGATIVLPTPIVNAVRDAVRRGDGMLTIQRAATQQERETRAAAVKVKGLDRHDRIDAFIEDNVGQLEGFTAMAPGNGLRDVLGAIEPLLSVLPSADIASLSDKQLRELSKNGSALDANLGRLRSLVATGRRLLRRGNIQQLARYATNRDQALQFERFLRDLP